MDLGKLLRREVLLRVLFVKLFMGCESELPGGESHLEDAHEYKHEAGEWVKGRPAILRRYPRQRAEQKPLHLEKIHWY